MSLYHEAAALLNAKDSKEGSFQSRVFNSKTSFKSKPALLYALISETSKWDTVLKEVVEKSNILSLEPKVCARILRVVSTAD